MKRRRFVSTSTAAAATGAFGFQVVPAHVARAQAGKPSPNSKIRLAAIGCGGQGAGDLSQMADEDIVALCDVDDRRAADSFEKFPGARRFKDFRVMLDEMGDSIDAVLVATPDHTHAVAAINAIARGKHVYCEKPLAHTIAEVRAMRAAAKEKGVITQVGNQGNSSDEIRAFCEYVWAGAIGNVTEVHAGCDAFKEVYCQIGNHPDLLQGRGEAPAELDWDLWLGPAAERAYHPAYVPFQWRGFSAFGSGCLGDWVCHVLDPTFWALDLDMPTSVVAETEGWNPKEDAEYYPQGTRITFEFPAKGDRGPVRVVWHDGDFSIPRPAELEEGRQMVGTGAIVIGDEGKIMHGSHGAGGIRIIPEAKHREFPRPDRTIPRVRGGHYRNWLEMVRAGEQRGSSFEYGGALSEIGLLGVIAAHHPGERLEWDAEAMKVTNHGAADAMVRGAHREGWEL